MERDGGAVSAPPVIHQPCGKEAIEVSSPGTVFHRVFMCADCCVMATWPNVDFQYAPTEPEQPPKNCILITVQQWAEDIEKPISTEFPIACADAAHCERLSEAITYRIRKLLESLNV